MAMGFGVLSAAEAAADGRSAQEVAEVARVRAAGAKVAFYVDTLEYLRRGGRIGSASALLGSALAIKPILTLLDGAIRPLERVRTASRALARLAELTTAAAVEMTADGGGVDIAVQHLDSAASGGVAGGHVAGASSAGRPRRGGRAGCRRGGSRGTGDAGGGGLTAAALTRQLIHSL